MVQEIILPLLDQDALASLVRAGDRGDTIYVPNSGNAGDSLIAEATYQFLDRTGLRYRTAFLTDIVPQGARVIVGGGGNLVAPYTNVRNFIDRNFERFGQMILLPHSIRGHDDILARLDDRFTLICREPRSFDHCREQAPGAKLLLGEDMALLWDPANTRTVARRTTLTNVADIRFDLRNLKHMTRRIAFRRRIHDGTLNAFRTDVETKGTSPVPPDNVDLSEVFATDSMARAYSACAVHALASLVRKAKRVRSDRLHISIISAILGRDVEMHDNSYGKNSSIYDHSLARRFPNLNFVR